MIRRMFLWMWMMVVFGSLTACSNEIKPVIDQLGDQFVSLGKIGPKGGRLCIGLVCVDVPAGAVDREIEILARRVSGDSSDDIYKTVGIVVEFKAEVDTFLQPIQLQLPLPNGLSIPSLRMAYRSSKTQQTWTPVSATPSPDNQALVTSTVHFSQWSFVDFKFDKYKSRVTGLAVDPAGFIYVTRPENKQVVKLQSLDHQTQQWVYQSTDPNKQFDKPTDIAWHQGKIYIVDQGKHQIVQLDDDLSDKNWKTLSMSGKSPEFIAVDASGSIYVTALSSGGSFFFAKDMNSSMAPYGRAGSGQGQFFLTKGLAFGNGQAGSAKGLYVVDQIINWRIAYTADLNFSEWSTQGSYGDRQAGSYRFNFPTDVAIDAGGFAYVADSRNSRVIRMKLVKQGGVLIWQDWKVMYEDTAGRQPLAVAARPDIPGEVYIGFDNGDVVKLVDCPVGQLKCQNQCIDPQNSPTHCGSCGNACSSSQSCVLGKCFSGNECPEGYASMAGKSNAKGLRCYPIQLAKTYETSGETPIPANQKTCVRFQPPFFVQHLIKHIELSVALDFPSSQDLTLSLGYGSRDVIVAEKLTPNKRFSANFPITFGTGSAETLQERLQKNTDGSGAICSASGGGICQVRAWGDGVAKDVCTGEPRFSFQAMSGWIGQTAQGWWDFCITNRGTQTGVLKTATLKLETTCQTNIAGEVACLCPYPKNYQLSPNTGECEARTGSNSPPLVETIADIQAESGFHDVILRATVSDLDFDVVKVKWEQTSGTPAVTIVHSDRAIASFRTPIIEQPTTLSFKITVTDAHGAEATAQTKVALSAFNLAQHDCRNSNWDTSLQTHAGQGVKKLYRTAVLPLQLQEDAQPPRPKEDIERMWWTGAMRHHLDAVSNRKHCFTGKVYDWLKTTLSARDSRGQCIRATDIVRNPTDQTLDLTNFAVDLDNVDVVIVFFSSGCGGNAMTGAKFKYRNRQNQIVTKTLNFYADWIPRMEGLFQGQPLDSFMPYEDNGVVKNCPSFQVLSNLRPMVTEPSATMAHEYLHTLDLRWHANHFYCARTGGNCSWLDCYQRLYQVKPGCDLKHVEYGNTWDVMGSNARYMGLQINGIYLEFLNWLDPQDLVSVTSSTRVTLAPLETPGTRFARIARILPKPGSRVWPQGYKNPHYFYYVEWRQPLGYDATMASYPPLRGNADGIMVLQRWPVYMDPLNTNMFNVGESILLDMTPNTLGLIDDVVLKSGKSYTDPDAEITLCGVEIAGDKQTIRFYMSYGSSCICPQVDCNGSCVNTQTDNQNCGTCGNTCPSGQTCQRGKCCASATTCECNTGETVCEGSCVQLQNNLQHCGACKAACAAGQTCQNGKCCQGASCGCSVGLVDCSGTCVEIANSSQHCGACGNSCGVGQVCVQGRCSCQQDSDCKTSGHVCANGICASCPCYNVADIRASRNQTGAQCLRNEENVFPKLTFTGVSFQRGQEQHATGTAQSKSDPNTYVCAKGCVGNCESGPAQETTLKHKAEYDACVAIALQGCEFCPPGETSCNNRCTDITKDIDNCGACGRSCGRGQICRAGECGPVSCLVPCEAECCDHLGAGYRCAPKIGATTPPRYECVQGVNQSPHACTTPPGTTGSYKVCEDLRGNLKYCVDIHQDRSNCGDCAVSCRINESCCGGQCVNLSQNNNHCGQCAKTCPTGQSCEQGICRAACSGSLQTCSVSGNRYCADTSADPDNCGNCGIRCSHEQTCQQGKCTCDTGKLSCEFNPSAQSNSIKQCAESATNAYHCSQCTKDMNSSSVCKQDLGYLDSYLQQVAQIADSKKRKQIMAGCEYQPTITASNDQNTVLEGKNWAPLAYCDQGKCQACPPNQVFCDGLCVDGQNNPHHCGGCHKACAEDQFCDAGQCTTSASPCPSKATPCNFELHTDNQRRAWRWKNGTYALHCQNYHRPQGEIGADRNGLYWIKPDFSKPAFLVYCDMTGAIQLRNDPHQDGGWTLIARERPGQQGNVRFLGTNTGIDIDIAKGRGDGLLGKNMNGRYTQVLIRWGAHYLKFDTTKEIFASSPAPFLLVNQIVSSHPLINFIFGQSGGSDMRGYFCRVNVETSPSVPGSEKRYGDSSWGLTTLSSSQRICGCNNNSWRGEGLYYGGVESGNTDGCGAWGGGWSGLRLDGESGNTIGLQNGYRKGGILCHHLTLWVR